jgi:hypothetical protein
MLNITNNGAWTQFSPCQTKIHSKWSILGGQEYIVIAAFQRSSSLPYPQKEEKRQDRQMGQ